MRDAFDVPPKVLPELDSGPSRIVLVVLGHTGVLDGDREARLDRRRRRWLLALQQRPGPREYPGLAEAATSDHDARTRGLLAHAERVLGRLDIAVAEHGNLERFDHCGDLIPAGGPGIHLGACPRMQREHAGARILTPECDGDGIAELLAPATADLHGDRQVGRPRDGAN